MSVRSDDAGVTLIEMLAALAVSALIGLAGFALLESVVRTEAGAEDRLDHLARQERAFQLLALDLQSIQRIQRQEDGQLALIGGSQTIIWRASSSGLERRVKRRGRDDILQNVLPDHAQLSMVSGNRELLKISLPDDDVWRVFHVPQQDAP